MGGVAAGAAVREGSVNATREAPGRRVAAAFNKSIAYRLARASADRLRDRVAAEARARVHAVRHAARARAIAIEDAADSARLVVRRNPWRAVGLAFVAGGAIGVIATAAALTPRSASR